MDNYFYECVRHASEPEWDLFNSNISESNFIGKKNNPGHSQICRSPLVLPPIHPIQNETHHPEPSAAVMVSTSPSIISSSMVVRSASPREPQIGSLLDWLSCLSTVSQSAGGVVPPTSLHPPFIPPQAASNKDSVSGSKILNNSYKHVSDMLVPSCKESVTLSKPTISLYDFLSNQSASSSPEEGIFLSQSEFHHKGVSPLTVPSSTKKSPVKNVIVSNGHSTNICVVSTPPSPVLGGLFSPRKHKTTITPSAPVHSASSSMVPASLSAAVSTAAPVSMRTTVLTSVTMSTSTLSHVLAKKSGSPTDTTSHPNMHTPVPARDTHSSFSNCSLSSLTQLSIPIHKEKKGGGSCSHSNSSSFIPPASASAYASASSLPGLVFSKPQHWSGSSNTTNTITVSVTRSSPALSSSGSTGLPLPTTLPSAHHTSSFSSHPRPPPSPLLPVASHDILFGTGSLPPTLPLEATGGPAPYRVKNLFSQPSEYTKYPDLLKQELVTRYLTSQDHSIPITLPPYVQNEVQQHSQIHEQLPFIASPPLSAPMVSQAATDVYEKYGELKSLLNMRPWVGLSGYQSLSSLLASGRGSFNPFVPPAHLTDLKPKLPVRKSLDSYRSESDSCSDDDDDDTSSSDTSNSEFFQMLVEREKGLGVPWNYNNELTKKLLDFCSQEKAAKRKRMTKNRNRQYPTSSNVSAETSFVRSDSGSQQSLNYKPAVWPSSPSPFVSSVLTAPRYTPFSNSNSPLFPFLSAFSAPFSSPYPPPSPSPSGFMRSPYSRSPSPSTSVSSVFAAPGFMPNRYPCPSPSTSSVMSVPVQAQTKISPNFSNQEQLHTPFSQHSRSFSLQDEIERLTNSYLQHHHTLMTSSAQGVLQQPTSPIML